MKWQTALYLSWLTLSACAAPASGNTGLHLIDDQGTFAAESLSDLPDTPLPTPNGAPRLSGPHRPVRCRLVDYIDCTLPDTHQFSDDKGSRVLELPGGRFRVTAAPRGFELKWFSYRIRTANRAGTPHLLVLESPNDRERYTTACLTVPKAMPWSPPYTGQEKDAFHGYLVYQSPVWYEPDVGLTVYTGRELPIDNQPFRWQFLFYPKTAEMKLTISSSGWDTRVEPQSGGAVSRVWVFEVLDALQDHRPKIQPPEQGRQRYLGFYATHPWYFLAHYGIPPHTRAQRRESLERFCDLLAFCGVNLLEYNIINGADRSTRAWYPTDYYPQIGVDFTTGKVPEPSNERPVNLIDELAELAASRGISLVPVVTSLIVPGRIDGHTPNKHGFSADSIQRTANPALKPLVFDHPAPDPLRPETQAWMIRHLTEIAERSRAYPNIIGVGFRVNGKLGTCYAAGEDKTSGRITVVSADEMGYSPWNLDEFRRDSGLAVPDESQKAYHWLKADPDRWDRWLDFRCRRTRDFWLRARDAIRAVHRNLVLYVLTDLPAETPATNVQWPGPQSPEATRASLDLLRAHGYDPRMFRDQEGIVVQRVMMVALDRFFGKWGPPWGANPQRYTQFHEQEELARWYRTLGGSAVEIYPTYWEEGFHPDGEFGPNAQGFGLRTSTPMPLGRAFYHPAMFSLRVADVDTIVLTGWHRPTLGREHEFRRFAQAVRGLPLTTPHPIRFRPADSRISAAWYGDRIGVINDTPDPIHVELTLDSPLPPGRALRDLATGQSVDLATTPAGFITVRLDGYDMRVLKFGP